MTIQVGDTVPDVTLKRFGDNGLEDISTASLFADRKVVLFGVPGAYTPSCALKHLPGYVANAEAIKAKGVDDVVCVAVNDPFVMKAWGESSGAAGKVIMLPDWMADFTSAMGLTFDASGAGLGTRSKRFAMIVENGVVKDIQVEDVPSAVELSGAEACLVRL